MKKLEADCSRVAEKMQWEIACTSPIEILDLKKGTKTAYTCNKNKRTNEKQREGTYITMKDQYGQYVKEMGKDGTGLGRQTQLRIEGNNEIKTTVITVYSPCNPKQSSYYSTYAQKKYLEINGLKECA